MSSLRRLIIALALACIMLVSHAPRHDAHALLLPAIPAIATWILGGATAATTAAVVVDVMAGRNVATLPAQQVANTGTDIATTVGAVPQEPRPNLAQRTRQHLERLDELARQEIQRTANFFRSRIQPAPDDIAGRAVAFTEGPPIFASFVQRFIQSASQAAQRFGTRIAAEILTILNYVFLIWLLLQIAQMMLGMARGSEIFWNVVKRSSIYLILVFMLLGVQSGEYWRWFVQEPLQATSNMIQALAGSAGGPGLNAALSCAPPASADAATSAAAVVCTTERVLRGGIAAGWTLVSATPLPLLSPNRLPIAIANTLAGFALCLLFAFPLIYFAFFVIDIFLRILILAMFSPIFIAFYLLQSTRNVTRNAINNLISSLFTLLGAVAMLSIVATLIGNFLGNSNELGNWERLIRDYAQRAINFDPNVGVGDAGYWTLAFAALTLIGSAKAIGALMGSLFGSAAPGIMAGKAMSIATIPLKALPTAAATAAGGAAILGAKAIAGGASKLAGRKIGWNK